MFFSIVKLDIIYAETNIIFSDKKILCNFCFSTKNFPVEKEIEILKIVDSVFYSIIDTLSLNKYLSSRLGL